MAQERGILFDIGLVDTGIAKNQFTLATVGNNVDGVQVLVVGEHGADVVQGILAQGDHQGGTGNGVGAAAYCACRVGVGKIVIRDVDHAIHQELVVPDRGIHENHLIDRLTGQEFVHTGIKRGGAGKRRAVVRIGKDGAGIGIRSGLRRGRCVCKLPGWGGIACSGIQAIRYSGVGVRGLAITAARAGILKSGV